MKNYSNSEREIQRLEKLQQGVVKEAAEKKYSEREAKAAKGVDGKFGGDLKKDGRLQPLRLNDSKLNRTRKGISKVSVVTNMMSKIDWSNDGLYFVVFLVSVVGDIGTMAIGSVEAIPGGGWILGVVAGVATRTFVLGVSAVIALLYMMNGHYKRRMAIMKIAVLMGFSFLELMPIVTALPGFIGSFIINYAIVLYGRSMDEILNKTKVGALANKIVVGKKMAAINEARKRAYAERANTWQGQVEDGAADDYARRKAV